MSDGNYKMTCLLPKGYGLHLYSLHEKNLANPFHATTSQCKLFVKITPQTLPLLSFHGHSFFIPFSKEYLPNNDIDWKIFFFQN